MMYTLNTSKKFATMLMSIALLLLGTTTPASAAGVTDLAIANTSSGTDLSAWVRFDDGTRLWIDADCRARLVAQGVTQTPLDWNIISAMPESAWRSCDSMVEEISPTDPNLPVNESVFKTNLRTCVLNQSLCNSRAQCTFASRPDFLRCLKDPEKDYIDITVTDLPDDLFWDGWTIQGQLQRYAGLNVAPATVIATDAGSNEPSYFDLELSEGTRHCVGVNDGFSYSWDGGQLVTDAFKNAQPALKANFRGMATTDANGWPAGDETIYFPLGEGEHDLEKLNPWVLLPYSQSDTWQAGPSDLTWKLEGANYTGAWNSGAYVGHEFELGDETITLKVSGGHLPASPKNRWHLVPKSAAKAYANAMKAERFSYIFNTDKYGLDPRFPLIHQSVKDQMGPFCRIRYMIGNQTNSLAFSGLKKDRTKPSQPTWNTKGGDGLPFEWKVWIANHLEVDVWHTDHVKTWEGLQAGDRYLRKQARYYRDNLKGGVIREYANEIWNTAWPFSKQTNWIWKRKPFADSTRSSVERLSYSYGKRAYDTAGVWEALWKRRRNELDLTIAIRADEPWQARTRLIGPGGQAWHTRADSVSASFYFGKSLNPDEFGFQEILENGNWVVVNNHAQGIEEWKTNITKLMELTQGLVSRHHLYEGASHQAINDFDATNPDHVEVAAHITEYLHSDTYTQHLSSIFAWWQEQPRAGEAMWFLLTGKRTPEQPWGLYPNAVTNEVFYRGEREFLRDYLNSL